MNSCGIVTVPQRRETEIRLCGGEGGIRTLDTLPYTHFPGVLLQPLGHLSGYPAPKGTQKVKPERRGVQSMKRVFPGDRGTATPYFRGPPPKGSMIREN